MFIADVVAVNVSDEYFDKSGKFHFNKSTPVCYSHGEYFTLGESLGTFGYSVRKKPLPKGKKSSFAPKKETHNTKPSSKNTKNKPKKSTSKAKRKQVR